MFNRKGQNIAEYSILIALVIAAAVAMQVYVKRGVQGRVADAVDFTGGTVGTNLTGDGTGNLTFSGRQFEPGYVESNAQVSSNRGLQEGVSAGGIVNRTSVNETTTRASGSYEKTTYNATAGNSNTN